MTFTIKSTQFNPFIQLTLVSILCVGVMGCGKKSDSSTSTSTLNANNAAATTASSVEAVKNTAAQTSSSGAVGVVDTDASKKRTAVEFALYEDKIKHDPNGQWAINVTASTTFADEVQAREEYRPMQVAGEPNAHYGIDPLSWAPRYNDTGIEWLDLEYAKAVQATEVRVRQTYHPGAVVAIELFDETGKSFTMFQGVDESPQEDQVTWFNVKFEKTPFKTKHVKVTLATNAVPGSNAIDAVQLVGE